jgi:GNAT superfamily N-acetyltransferase
MVEVREAKSRGDLKRFIKLAYDLYKDDPNWVAPLRGQLFKTLRGKNNPRFDNGPVVFFLAWDGDTVVGRIMAGIDETVVKEKNRMVGYFCLFECIEDAEAAYALLDAAMGWLKERGMTGIEGPVSPTGGDDYRGLLVMGFDGPPALMNTYNHEYYRNFFEDYGFEKQEDLFAFYIDVEHFPVERYRRVVEYCMDRFHFHVDQADFKQVEREIRDIKEILELAVPDDWEDFVVPSVEDIRKEARFLLPLLKPELVQIAREDGTNRPIGFVVGAPDYNQVLQKLNGRLFPFGVLKALHYRKKIDGARIFIQFVIPEYQSKGVNGAIFYHMILHAKEVGITHGDGSTIGEDNLKSRQSVERAGGKHYRTYRRYQKAI